MIYFGYFGSMAVLFEAVPRHLFRLGISEAETGAILSFKSLAVLFIPLVLGVIADRMPRRNGLLVGAILLSTVGLAGVAWAKSPAAITVAMLIYAITSAPIPTLTDAATLRVTTRTGQSYARIRFWGSFGFFLIALVLAGLNTLSGLNPRLLLFMGPALLLIASVAATRVPEAPPTTNRPTLKDIAALLSDVRIRRLLLVAGVHWVSMMPFHSFLSIHVDQIGAPTYTSGMAFAVAAGADAIVMVLYHRFSGRMRPRAMLLVACSTAVIRWIWCASTTDPTVLIWVQLSHGLSFALFYLAVVQALTEMIPDRLRASGQGLFFSLTFGVFGTAGSNLAGQFAGAFGTSGMFWWAAGCASLATIGALFLPRD